MHAHCSPALSRHPHAPVREVLAEAIRIVEGGVGLHGLIAAGQAEFVAPIEANGAVIDKGAIISALPGGVLYAGDDFNDIPAARAAKAKGGLVLVVNRAPRGGTAGTPAELLSLADCVVPDARRHGRVIADLAAVLASRAPASRRASVVRKAPPALRPAATPPTSSGARSMP